MSAAAPVLWRSWQVGERTCTLTVPRAVRGKAAHASVEWSPDVPHRLSQAEWQQYRAGRNQAAAELARQLGGMAAVIEL